LVRHLQDTAVGKTFCADGAHWKITAVTSQQNRLFCWLLLQVKWAGYGQMPLWSRSPQQYVCNRRRLQDGTWC